VKVSGGFMLGWARRYRRRLLAGDISAGIVVAMMMVPQSMAYAMVAGLPPVAGLYASILPPLLYAVFGTSMTQSVGPMAIISLMTASSLARRDASWSSSAASSRWNSRLSGLMLRAASSTVTRAPFWWVVIMVIAVR